MGERQARPANLHDVRGCSGERECCETLLERPGARIERIVSTGQATPPGEWYDQGGDEWVALLSGRATLSFERGGRLELAPGDWLLIPAHARHRVEATSTDPPCVWLAVHLPPLP
jgi:cupin 2 domain-containing protein